MQNSKYTLNRRAPLTTLVGGAGSAALIDGSPGSSRRAPAPRRDGGT